MSSQARTSREEERRLSVRTLVIASASSAVAAIVTSRLWAAGTPIAAAMTPVLVTLVSELLHRPAEKIAERLTTETDVLPEAAGAGPPPPAAETGDVPPAREQPRRQPGEHRTAPGGDEVRVYRSRKRVLPWKLIAATAALAFLIGIAVLTLPQVIAGESLLKGNPPLYDSASKGGEADREPEPRQAPARPEEQPEPTVPEQTTPQETETQPAPTTTTPDPDETTPEETQTQTAPAPQQPAQP